MEKFLTQNLEPIEFNLEPFAISLEGVALLFGHRSVLEFSIAHEPHLIRGEN